MTTPVLLPARFIRLGAERLLFPEADSLDAVGGDSRSYQRVLHCTGAVVAEGQVVFRRAALVAVSLNREVDAGMLLQERDIGLNGGLIGGANVGLVVIEVNVLHILREQLLLGERRRRWRRRWWRRRIYRDASGCCLGPSCALCR